MTAISGGTEPPSRRLARLLREEIATGELNPGDRLPSERALAAEHKVARNTASAAIRILLDEGLVTAEHGRGVFVREKRRLLRFGSERYSHRLREETGLSPYRAELGKQGREPRIDCTSITRVTPPPEVAERLNIKPEPRSVVRRENWYYADDEPMQMGVTYIPWFIAKDSVIGCQAKMGKGSLYARFEDLGYPISRVREEISARMPTPDETEGLHIPNGVPVIEVTHTGIDDQERPFEVTFFIMRSDHMGLDYNMPVED